MALMLPAAAACSYKRHRLLAIDRLAAAVFVHRPEAILRRGEALFGRPLVPLRRLRLVPGHGPAVEIAARDHELGNGVTPDGRLAERRRADVLGQRSTPDATRFPAVSAAGGERGGGERPERPDVAERLRPGVAVVVQGEGGERLAELNAESEPLLRWAP
jgi:hypothetical protein